MYALTARVTVDVLYLFNTRRGYNVTEKRARRESKEDAESASVPALSFLCSCDHHSAVPCLFPHPFLLRKTFRVDCPVWGNPKMTTLSSFFPSKFLGSMHPRDRTSDPLARLRFALDTMPGSRKFVFTPATRAEILSELYDSFWGSYAHMFLPHSNSSLPLHAMLSEVQTHATPTKEHPASPGRPCGHIFMKGESCFRCK